MVETGRKGPYYLLTGLIIGLILGIFYGWIINPTRYVDISPEALHPDQKKQYLLLVAESYQANEDIGRSYYRIKQMTNPVNIDELRAMLLEMESDPDYTEQFDVVRNFINDLDSYLKQQNPDNKISTQQVQGLLNPSDAREKGNPAMAIDEQFNKETANPESYYVNSN